jgi:DNA-binding CsgD family transcriptional regulator
LLVRALFACGSASVYDTDISKRYLAEASDLARALGDRWRLSQILIQQAQAAFVAGDPAAVRAAGEEGRDLADAIGDCFGSRQCRWRLAAVPLFEGDLVQSIAQHRAVIAESEANHDIMSLATALMVLPHALAYHGEVDAALTVARAGIESATELGDVYLGGNYMALSVSQLAAGDVAAASEAANAGWSHLGGLYGTASINSAYIAQTALARGDLTAARNSVDDAVAATAGWFLAVALMIRARIAVAQGQPEQAERDAHEALACCAEYKAYLFGSDILEILAGLASDTGSYREAARLFAAAEGNRHRTGEVRFAIYQGAYDLSVGRVRKAMSDAAFEAAWAEGAALSRDEAIAYAQRGRGERKRPSSGWASLTPAELDVVRLVSEGLGNKDIAARLFVSPRTVQSHLTRVYTKLGLTSRVQLAQEATRRSATTNG